MTVKLFSKLWLDAIVQPSKELYIAEYGYPDWFDEIAEDPEKVVNVLGNIHDVAHMSIRDMWMKSGMSQANFAESFCIPRRTMEDWVRGIRKSPDYIRLMMARLMGLLEVDING